MERISFVLCDPKRLLCQEWSRLVAELPSAVGGRFTVFDGRLEEFTRPFDCIVLPANSYAKLDGSFDLVIARLFNRSDPRSVVTHCQRLLFQTHRGYQVPGTCSLMPMHAFGPKANSCSWIAHCPTMRKPSDCRWNREIVYNCFYSLLNELHKHNTAHPLDPIRSVFVTGLGTGVGDFPEKACASQMILAYKHFLGNLANQHRGHPTTSWDEIATLDADIASTYDW